MERNKATLARKDDLRDHRTGVSLFPEIRFSALPRTDGEALERLAAEANDAEALIALYESHRTQFNKSAARWFGRNPELRRRALHEILVAVGRRASVYDPRLDAAEWITKCADSEARRLRKIMDCRDRERRHAKPRGVH